MQQIFLDKVVINIGVGQNENLVDNAKALIKKLTDHEAGTTVSKRRDPELKLRKGQLIGAVSTLRKKEAFDFLKRALDANSNVISHGAVAGNSLNFGIKEYIYFTGVKYDPKIGILGMNVNAAFARKGARVAKKRRRCGVPGKIHSRITREEIMQYLKNSFNVKMQE